LTRLTSLDLNGNQVADVSPLAGLATLTSLNLSDNLVSDASPLSGLTNLTVLELSFNQFSDVTPLAGLTNLAFIGLQSNHIADISSLVSLVNVTNATFDAQSLTIPSIEVGAAQANPVVAVDGSAVAPTSFSAVYDAASNTWTFAAAAADNQLDWVTDVTIGSVTVSFSGRSTQTLTPVVVPPVIVPPVVTPPVAAAGTAPTGMLANTGSSLDLGGALAVVLLALLAGTALVIGRVRSAKEN
jgi:hypothetical protein